MTSINKSDILLLKENGINDYSIILEKYTIFNTEIAYLDKQKQTQIKNLRRRILNRKHARTSQEKKINLMLKLQKENEYLKKIIIKMYEKNPNFFKKIQQ